MIYIIASKQQTSLKRKVIMHTSTSNMLLAAIAASVTMIVPVCGMVASPNIPDLLPRSGGAAFTPILQGNFADPSIIEVDGITYTFSTTDSGLNVPIATQHQGQGAEKLMAGSNRPQDAMPSLPQWSSGGIWAPHVVRLVSIMIQSSRKATC